jgi:hypothetical protein
MSIVPIMRTAAIICPRCGSKVYKMRAQTGEGDLPLGTYCPSCKCYQDPEGRELRPVVPLKNESEIGDILDKQFFEGDPK